MAIYNQVLETAQTDVLTVPADKKYAILTVLVCNYASTGSARFTLHLVQNGDPRGDQNMIVNELELPAGETFTLDSEKIVLDSGDFISCYAQPDSGSGLTDLAITVSWMEAQ